MSVKKTLIQTCLYLKKKEVRITMKFPTLYNTNKAGKTQEWDIWVEDHKTFSLIVTTYGLTDGKKTRAETKITKGKNEGKANATTYYTQAISEAQSKWNSKKDKEYTEKGEKVNKNIYLPMLAFDYFKRGKDIKFPCYVQPKLDGVRAIFNTSFGAFQSRTGKKFAHLEHIIEELKPLNLLLDGELYSNTLTFQEITGMVNKKKLTEEDISKQKEIIFVVYDIIIEGDYMDRLKVLKEIFKLKFKYTELLQIDTIKKAEELDAKHDFYVSKGYEGMIIRNFEGKYDLKNRSKNLQKYKKFDDDEFKIVGFTEGTGIEEGLVIWICETKEGKTFQVRPKGTHEERRKLFKDAKKYIGKPLTVRFFGYTDDGIPRFPIGITVRNYE